MAINSEIVYGTEAIDKARNGFWDWKEQLKKHLTLDNTLWLHVFVVDAISVLRRKISDFTCTK